MRILRNSFLGLAAVALLASGCEHADPIDADQIQPTLSSIQENVFNLNCALSGCHAGPNPQQGMDLSEGQAFDNIVNVQSNEMPSLLRVDPGNPQNSYLFQKITGATGIVGSQMPLGRAPLSAEEIEAVRQWIADGAPDN